MKVDVHVYKGSQLMATVQRAQKGEMDTALNRRVDAALSLSGRR
jgi:hypothetical protein